MKKIDYTYIINLNTPNEEIVERLSEANYPEQFEYYIYPAVNGWDKDLKSKYKFKTADWWKIESNNSFWNREVTPGKQVVCYPIIILLEQPMKKGMKLS
jgi:hypothetical protein